MGIKPSERYRRDKAGQWWYHYGAGERTRTSESKCKHCGKTFLPCPMNKGQRRDHCSRRCGLLAGYAKRDPALRRGKNSRHWRGGKLVNRSGYIMVNQPDHPSLQGTTRRYVLEHRLVMEETLGRLLERDEVVHHLNGVKDDNRPENLELWKHGHPPGQREEEALCAECGHRHGDGCPICDVHLHLCCPVEAQAHPPTLQAPHCPTCTCHQGVS